MITRMMTMIFSSLLLLLLLASTPTAHALFIPLAQDRRPGDGATLRLWDGRPVRWDTGEVAALIETSSAARVSYRGIHLFDHPIGLAAADGHPCPRCLDALCVLADGRRVLPHRLPRFSSGDEAKTAPMRVAALDGGCGLEDMGGRVLVDDPWMYDLSPCDLQRVDVLWSDGRVYVNRDARLPLWAYILSAICVLFLVMSLGQNLGLILGDPHAATEPWYTELACIGQSGLMLALNDPYRVWAAQQDRAMLWATLAYLLLYLSRHGCALFFQTEVHTLNVITATLILVTARLYGSFETPYGTVFLVLLLTRLAHKLFEPRLTGVERLSMAADTWYAALHYHLAYRPSFFDPQAAPVYLCALAVGSLSVGAVTHGVERRAARGARRV